MFEGYAMFFWNRYDETPLTQAVIANNIELVERLAHHNSHRKAENFLGFNADDLALYLGRDEIIEVLGLKKPARFKVLKKGEEDVVEMGVSEYESFFQTRYTSSLRMTSYPDFCKIIKKCPSRVKKGGMGVSMRGLFEENREKIKSGYVCESTIKWISDQMGYGLFTDRFIRKGEFIGEYVGLLLIRQIISKIEGNYCMRYPKLSFGLSYYTVDAERIGNETRFINHNYVPNVKPDSALEKGFSHCVMIALRDIEAGEQLTYDYGEDYWRHRNPPLDF